MSTQPTTLSQRIELVCQRRSFGERAWCRSAGLSEGYLSTQRSREADEGYVLPERAAMRLAAAANVNIEWLRFGRGAMAPDDADEVTTVTATVRPLVRPRDEAIRTLMQVASQLHAGGDIQGLRVVMEALRDLVGQRTTAAEDPEHDAVSGARQKVSA